VVLFALACTPEDHSVPDAPPTLCTSDRACDDGYFCNGVERCDPGGVRPDSFGCHPGVSPCPEACDEIRRCIACGLADRDRDGENEIGCGGDDCDDEDADIHPGALERCNGADDDCDGRIDEELRDVLFLDRDGDGHGDPLAALGACADEGATAMVGDDCDDTDPTIHPGALEACNGVDDDCDARVDFGAICGARENYACEAGRCVVHTCLAGRADCNDLAADGCEAVLAEDLDHCGRCDRSCRSPEGARVCVAGECVVAVCPAGQHTCGESCFRDDDPLHCGAECAVCPPAPAHGTATCRYRCGVACDDGFIGSGGPDGVTGCTYRDPRLTSLRVMGQALAPPFLSSILDYAVEIPLTTATISLIADVPAGSDLELTFDGIPFEPGVVTPELPVPPGLTRHEIHVTSFSGYPRVYTLWVLRGEPSTSRIADPAVVESRRSFGAALAMSGSRIAVYSPRSTEGVAGVTLHEWVGGAWELDATITPPAGVDSGVALAMSGDWLAVGAPHTTVEGLDNAGAVLLYHRGASGWTAEATLTALTPTAIGVFGSSVAMHGDLLVVGAPRDPTDSPLHEGAVYAYRLVGTAWVFEERFESGAASSAFGQELALEGGVVIVGVEILESRSTGWVRLESLVAPPGMLYLAARVAISGDLVAVSASRNDAPYGEDRGVALLFERVGDAYRHLRTVSAPNGGRNDEFATSLALAGDLLVVGAPGEAGRPGRPFDDTLPYSGAAYAFRHLRATPEVWYLKSTASPSATFGESVAVHGTTVVVGAGPAIRAQLDVFVLP
jgi:hypothetical protein